MCQYCDNRKKALVAKVVAAEGTGKAPCTADGRPIVVLTDDRWFTTSCYNVRDYDVARARDRVNSPADYEAANARERLRGR